MNLGKLLSEKFPERQPASLRTRAPRMSSWTVRRHPSRDGFFGRAASPGIGMPDPVPAHGEQVVAFVSLRDGVTANVREKPAERHHRENSASGTQGNTVGRDRCNALQDGRSAATIPMKADISTLLKPDILILQRQRLGIH